MGEPTYLDRAQMEEAFRIMGQYLLDRKALGEIAVYGGSAILFQFDWRKTSQDVDARVTSDGNHGLVMEAAAEAARRLGLLRSWLNESVTMYARRDEGVGDRVLIGSYPSPERCGLRVTAAKPAYILAMKLGALERPRVTIAISVTPLNLVSSATSRRSMSRTRSFASSSPTVSCRLRQSCVWANWRGRSKRGWPERHRMSRPQTLAEVASIARAKADDFAMALDEFTDEFYLDHPDKVAQQVRLDPIPEIVGDPAIDAWIGAAGEHLALRWGLRVPAWTQRAEHFALEDPIFLPATPALRGVVLVESPAAFRSRLIFTFAEPLARARFPAGVPRARVALQWPPPDAEPVDSPLRNRRG